MRDFSMRAYFELLIQIKKTILKDLVHSVKG